MTSTARVPGLPAVTLTPKEIVVLKMMADEDEELVYSKGVGYVGLERVSRKTVMTLLRACAISLDQFSTVGECERYTINTTGREYLNPEPLGRGNPSSPPSPE